MLREDLVERLERLDEDAYLLFPGENRFREEVKLNALNERKFNDFLFNYEEYIRRYRP